MTPSWSVNIASKSCSEDKNISTKCVHIYIYIYICVCVCAHIYICMLETEFEEGKKVYVYM